MGNRRLAAGLGADISDHRVFLLGLYREERSQPPRGLEVEANYTPQSRPGHGTEVRAVMSGWHLPQRAGLACPGCRSS